MDTWASIIIAYIALVCILAMKRFKPLDTIWFRYLISGCIVIAASGVLGDIAVCKLAKMIVRYKYKRKIFIKEDI